MIKSKDGNPGEKEDLSKYRQAGEESDSPMNSSDLSRVQSTKLWAQGLEMLVYARLC